MSPPKIDTETVSPKIDEGALSPKFDEVDSNLLQVPNPDSRSISSEGESSFSEVKFDFSEEKSEVPLDRNLLQVKSQGDSFVSRSSIGSEFQSPGFYIGESAKLLNENT